MSEQRFGDAIADEINRLLKLVRRLEQENALLRRELAAARPVAA
jgi:cell division septum initiation protein DivIVA